MRRREFITLLGSAAAAWPLGASAQQPDRMRRIGVLWGSERTALAAYLQRLERLGWSEDRDVRIDIRFVPGGMGLEQPLAKELVALKPDVIIAGSTPVVAALQRESRTIPIVFTSVSDPIGAGFVASLARPGGNVTGLLLYEASIAGKWLAMLKEIAPQVTRVAIVANPEDGPFGYFLRTLEALAPLVKVELVTSPVEGQADIERVIESFARVPNGGIITLPDTTLPLHRDLIIALAARHRLPAVYSRRSFVPAGGLMAYGAELVDLLPQAASYVDRILRGEKPADLPVQTPTKYETAINLKTAKSLGLVVPPGLLVAASEVIE
jgi:putative tryptophan/tyrosine transport system substrate-binding protein